ncbi:hypothetical protein KFL_003240070 [Klebsormidium nitens]|uniref:Uncharacterized protein n=1 Tax=Klebsormidium nitens TaxID=105231 RepID=A0A1Y1IE58_KLENI|nr:hypothetical protein KFL_003240070 [Klebsormidium nitens]|eukprot:GAQ86986.1 hypothetical protein KFL_003240070 [Klebsormidium nitens]
MSADLYSNAIRRALIPADQAEALAQIPGWGPAQYGDDFTPLDAEEDTVPVEQADLGVQQEDASGLKDSVEDEIQATGGFLDLQEPARFTSQDEDLDSPNRADSYNEAFEDGTEEAAPVESQPPAADPAASAPDARFDEFQPMTQDPGFDSLLPFLAETAPQGLTQEREDESASGDEPEEAAEVLDRPSEQPTPENEDKVEATEEAVQQVEEDGVEEKGQDTGPEIRAKPAELVKSVEEEEGPVAEEQREEEDEEVFQDAVAEPASSQETASRLGRNRERKKAVNGSKSGVSGDVRVEKQPAPADAPASLRPSARTAAISKRVHAAAKAAEAARESSARVGTSSAFTAATALSKNVAQLSDSTQHARPTTRSGRAGTAVSHALTSGGRPAEAAGSERAELPELADRKLPEAGRGAFENFTVRETRSRKKAAEGEAERPEGPAGQAMEPAGVTLQPNFDVSPYGRSALEGPAGPATDSAGVTLQPNTDANEACEEPVADKGSLERGGTAVSGADRKGEGGTESAVQGARDEPEEAGTAEAAEADVPSEAPEKHGVALSLDGATGGQEAIGSGAEAPRRKADEAGGASDQRSRFEPDAAAPSTSRSDGKEAHWSQEDEDFSDDIEAHPQVEKQSEATTQHRDGANGAVHSEEAADEQDEDTVSAEAHGDPRKAWQVLEGTVQGESLKRRLPEMTMSEFRTRQSFPSDFVELVSLWPRRELKQQPVSLLTMSVDAGIWSPPPFYRGKRPRLR